MVAEEEKCIHVLQPLQQYALGQTSHLKRRRQQESIAACQPWLMQSRSKTGEIHQRNFGEKGWGGGGGNTKPIVAVNEDIAKFHQFSHLSPIIPDASSRKNYETFPSWGNCFYSKLILLFRLLSSYQSVCMCACARTWAARADTSE